MHNIPRPGIRRADPIDKIKIDQSFVTDMTQVKCSASIVTAVIGLARSLGLKVIAKGVETNEQLEALREQGCDEAQESYSVPRCFLKSLRSYFVTGNQKTQSPKWRNDEPNSSKSRQP
jgi:predicted signal transduction protein with EAL and GGDEF domain